jgi:SAM-dependent methyltransferase
MGHASKDSSIVEIGCAAATQTIELQRRGCSQAFGLDINERVLQIAQANAMAGGIDKAVFILGDAMSLPLETSCVDLTFSVGVLEHLPSPLDALVEQRRILKPGGWAIAAVPNRLCPWWSTAKRWRAWLTRNPHFAFPEAFRTFSPGQIRRVFKQAGFGRVKCLAADSVLPQCPDMFSGVAMAMESIVERTPGLRWVQAMLYVAGER